MTCKVKVTSGFPWWLCGKESACQRRRCEFDPWVGKIPWRRKWQHSPVFLPGNSLVRGAWWARVHGVTKSQTTTEHARMHILIDTLRHLQAWTSQGCACCRHWKWPGGLTRNCRLTAAWRLFWSGSSVVNILHPHRRICHFCTGVWCLRCLYFILGNWEGRVGVTLNALLSFNYNLNL